MKVRTRFIRSVVKTSQSCTARMPWTRGAARRAMIAKRMSPAGRLVHSA